MGKVLYWECGSGISGDMIVASLLDLGADEDGLRKVLSGIHEGGFEIAISRVLKSGIDCCDFNVILDAEHENHDHDMAYLYGTDAELRHHDHDHDHHHDDHEHHHDAHEHHHDHDEHDHDDHHHDCCEHEHDHAHHHDDHDHHHDHCAHDHEHGHGEHEHHHDHEHGDHEHHHDHAHHHHHTNLADVTRIIQGLEMTDRAREIALRTFQIVAEAESKAHNLPLDQVHFHEVGAIDSIVDIVAAAVCYDDLGITEVIVPRLAEGTGTVRCQHGVLPVPVPAVLNIVSAHHLPLQILENRKGELVTPTGAAFVAAVMTSRQLPKVFTPVRVGLGAGKRAYEIPSILRAILIEAPESAGKDADSIVKLECNIDDSTGEQLGYAMETLLRAGARDVHYFPVIMKKSRPAWQLNVITDEEHRKALEEIIFRETTTIGIRRMSMERTVLTRRAETVKTPYGEIAVKVCGDGAGERVFPEYDSVAAAAAESGASYTEVFHAAENAWHLA